MKGGKNKGAEQMNEIRDFGDKKTIVLYTDENKVYQRLKQSVKCFKVIPYEQGQYSKRGVVMVGVDLYFHKKYQKWLEGKLRNNELQEEDVFS